MKMYKSILKLITFAIVLITMQSCYKIKEKNFTKGIITCIDTNNVGVSGIKYRIFEKKYRFSNPTTFMTGETDQNGIAYFEFRQPSSINNNKWSYYLEILPTSFPNNYRASIQKGGNFSHMLQSTIDDESFNFNDVTIKFIPE